MDSKLPSINKAKSTVFLTGATGFLGSYLLKILLNNGHTVYVLSRPTPRSRADARIYAVLDFWDRAVLRKHKRNICVIEGDITKAGLGLAQRVRQKLADEVDEIIHSAAGTNVQVPFEEIRKANVEGTRNIFDLGTRLSREGRLRKINHLSTAFVCGKYQGVFKESDLDLGQDFYTSYERSKFEAEKLVPAYRKQGLWIDIFRPSIVIGESDTGKNFQFKNIYQFVHMCSLGLFPRLPLRGMRASIIPLDYTCEAIYRIASCSQDRNRTYHILLKDAMPIQDIIQCASKLMGFRSPRFISRSDFRKLKFTPAQKGLIERTLLAFNAFVTFDSQYTRKQLASYHFEYKRFTKNDLVPLFEYYLEAERGEAL